MVVNRGELCGFCVVVFVVEKHANFWRFIFRGIVNGYLSPMMCDLSMAEVLFGGVDCRDEE